MGFQARIGGRIISLHCIHHYDELMMYDQGTAAESDRLSN